MWAAFQAEGEAKTEIFQAVREDELNCVWKKLIVDATLQTLLDGGETLLEETAARDDWVQYDPYETDLWDNGW